jgi:tRNA(fMet)-specific endonuclease VapC
MLDTDTCIYLLGGRKPALTERVLRHPASSFVISSISAMELSFGAARSDRPQQSMERVRSLCDEVVVAAFDARAAETAGAIRAGLAKSGKPIGPYDVLIGGHALALGVTLITNNVREFRRIPDLEVESWA